MSWNSKMFRFFEIKIFLYSMSSYTRSSCPNVEYAHSKWKLCRRERKQSFYQKFREFCRRQKENFRPVLMNYLVEVNSFRVLLRLRWLFGVVHNITHLIIFYIKKTRYERNSREFRSSHHQISFWLLCTGSSVRCFCHAVFRNYHRSSALM